MDLDTDNAALDHKRDWRGRFAGPPPRPGAPAGNKNTMRHGLTTGRLPKGANYIARLVGQFRDAVETAVAEANGGDVSLYEAAVIQTAMRWERHALLAQRWLRMEEADLSPDQRLTFSRDIARASSERDRCLKLIGLDRRVNGDPWSALDVPSQPAVGIEDQQPDDQADNSTRGGDQQPDDQASLPSNVCGLPATGSPSDGSSRIAVDAGDQGIQSDTVEDTDTPSVKPYDQQDHDQAMGGRTDAS